MPIHRYLQNTKVLKVWKFSLNFSAHFSAVSFPALFFYFTRQRGHTSVPLINSSQFFQPFCLSMQKNRYGILNALAPIMFLSIPFYKKFLFPRRIAPTTKGTPFLFYHSAKATKLHSYRHPHSCATYWLLRLIYLLFSEYSRYLRNLHRPYLLLSLPQHFALLVCQIGNHQLPMVLQVTELLRQQLIKIFPIPVSRYFVIDSFSLPVCKFGRARYCCSFRTDSTNYGRRPSKKPD